MEEKKLFFNASDYEIQFEEHVKETSETIYIVKKIDNSTNYAAKIINVNKTFDGNEQMSFLLESSMFCKLCHPAISKFIGINFKSLINPDLFKPTIIYEYYPNGSLKDIVGRLVLTPTKKYINLLGISNAIQYLHEQGITITNLKPNNILLDSNYYPRVSDFYFTHLLKLTKEGQNDNSIYSAPEILLNKDDIDQSVDVYSFAIIAYEIITEKVPFEEVDSLNIQNKIVKGYRPTFSEFVPINLQSLLSRCWSEIPEKRPSFKEIFEILSCTIQFKDDSIDKDEIKRYLTILNESHVTNSNDHNKNDINDLKATFYTCFADFFQSINITQNNSKKIEYYEKAANLGNSDALNSLGNVYYFGDGVEQNFIKAKKCYKKAAELGNLDANYNLGNLYYFGDGVEQNFNKTLEYYEKAAELGNSDALNDLGTMYYNGDGVKQNISKAKEYFEKAANLGNWFAYEHLGNLYYYGEGVEQNFNIAKECYEKAANLGNIDALNILGNLYYHGDAIEQNFNKAKEYYEKAAIHGNSDALNNLGTMYYNGDGVKQNISKSKEYFEKAVNLGNSNACEYLNDIDHFKKVDSDAMSESFASIFVLMLMIYILYNFRNFLAIF